MRLSRACVFVEAAMIAGLVSPAGAQQDSSRLRQLGQVVTASPLHRLAHLRVIDLPLDIALTMLDRRSGASVVFSPSFLPVGHKVTCLCDSVAVQDALERILVGTGLRYREVEGQVMIYRGSRSGGRQAEEGAEGTPPMLLSVPTVRSMMGALENAVNRNAQIEPSQQAGSLAGSVLDDRGRAIQNANVAVAGSSGFRTSTDRAGRFRLDGLTGVSVTLHVSAIGYRPLTQSVRVGESSARLILTEMPLNLDELVVTGTAGAVEKRALGHAVSRIDAADVLESAPVKDVGQLLNARAPGVNIQTGTGMIGSGPRIAIRGQSSLTFAGDPLLYIDGVRVDNAAVTGPATQGGNIISRLNDLNPQDIDHIEIIKGPAAATLYGTEASRGVIQIVTKRGRAGARPQENIVVRQGTNWFMNLEERWPTHYWRFPNGTVDSANLAQREKERGTPLFRTGWLQGYTGSVSGGSDIVQYYLAADYDHDEGIDPTNEAEKVGGRANFNFLPSKAIQLSASTGFTLGRIKLAREEGRSAVFDGLFGNPRDLNTPRRGFVRPPEAIREAYVQGQDVNRFTPGLQMTHRPADWFVQRLATGIDVVDEQNYVFSEFMRPEVAQFFTAVEAAGFAQTNRRNVLTTSLDYGNTVTLKLGSNLTSQTSTGVQYYRTAIRTLIARGDGFPARGVTTPGAAAVRTSDQDFLENVTVGVYAQEQLARKERLFLTFALRGDDNSSFGANYDFIVYPKISASWVVSDEPFWRRVPVVNTLRLRAAYGASGQQPDVFAARRTFQSVTGPGGTPIVTPQLIGNPDLKPERGEELELGFEASLFGHRAGIDFTYYNRKTKDAILLRDAPLSLGFPGQQYVNIGETENHGFELRVHGRALETRNLDLDLSANFSSNSDKVVELGLPGISFVTSGIGGTLRKQVGFPINAIFVKRVVSAELDANGNSINVFCDGGPGAAPMPCAQAPRVFLGRVTPKTEGSFTAALTAVDRLRLYALVDFKSSFRRFENSTQFAACANLICEELVFPERFDPKRIAEVRGGIDYSWVYPDAGFAKLREVSLSYMLPDRWARAVRAARMSVTIAGRNLHTWTNHPGLDPETLLMGSLTPNGNYADQAQTPLPAQFVTTLNITF